MPHPFLFLQSGRQWWVCLQKLHSSSLICAVYSATCSEKTRTCFLVEACGWLHLTLSLTLSTVACSYSSLKTQLRCHLFQKTVPSSPTLAGQVPVPEGCSHDPFMLTLPTDLMVSYQMAHRPYPSMGLSDIQWGLVNWAGTGRCYMEWLLLRASCTRSCLSAGTGDKWWPGRFWASGDYAAWLRPALSKTLTILTGFLQGCPLHTTVPPAPMCRPQHL